MVMQVAVDRAALLKAASRAIGVVERRATIPILQHLLLEASGASLSIRATDLDIEIVEALPARVLRDGTATLPAHTFHEIIRKLPDGSEINLTAEEDKMAVAAGRSKFTLSTLPREDFPMMASAEFGRVFQIQSSTLRRLFDKTKFAISTEETRYYLNGVYFHIADDDGQSKLRAVATDGHRLARVDTDIPINAEGMAGVIVPRKTVSELRKLLENDDDLLNVAVSETKIRFSNGPMNLTSKVIDGTFPDYMRVIPSNNQLKMEVSPDRFSAAVDRVATVASERTRAVKMSLSHNRIVLSVDSQETGSATEELEASYTDPPLEIGFNSRFLMDIASQIDSETAVFMLSDPNTPILVREGDDTSVIFVVMPLRV
jgi:DNA polymerase-3 subunit beta